MKITHLKFYAKLVVYQNVDSHENVPLWLCGVWAPKHGGPEMATFASIIIVTIIVK